MPIIFMCSWAPNNRGKGVDTLRKKHKQGVLINRNEYGFSKFAITWGLVLVERGGGGLDA